MLGFRISHCAVAVSLLSLVGCTTTPFGDSASAITIPASPVVSQSSDKIATTGSHAPVRNGTLTTAMVKNSPRLIQSGTAPEAAGLHELKVPQVEMDDFSPSDAVTQDQNESSEPEAAPQTDDLWQRLRSGFQLSNLEVQPGRVAKFEKYYAKHPKYFTRLAERAQWFLPYVLEQVEQRQMPAEVAILPAIESAFRPDATSRSNAAGMWQFIGATGRRFGLRQDWWMDARRDLVQSTRAALDYLDYLSKEFDGDWELALAAYNAGEGNIRRQVKKNRANNLPAQYAHLRLRRETSEYVPRLMAVRNILISPEKFGIELAPLINRQTLKVVNLKTQTDLTVAASFLSLSSRQLKFLNLGYKRGVTPPNGPHVLVVPTEEADKLVAELALLNPTQRMQWAHHKVKKGEYLGKIARTHGVRVKSIMRSNSLTSNIINPGQELRIPLSTGAAQFAGPSVISDSGESRKHLVASGDSLWKISRKYRISLADVLKWNQISKKTKLYPGQSIIVSP